MTTFKPWEYRAEAGFVKGTELTGYTVVAVDGDLGQVVEAEYDGPLPAHLYVDVRSWLFGHHVDVAGRSRGADRRNGEEGVRRPYEGPNRARAQGRPGPGGYRPRQLLRGPGQLLLQHVHAAGWSCDLSLPRDRAGPR